MRYKVVVEVGPDCHLRIRKIEVSDPAGKQLGHLVNSSDVLSTQVPPGSPPITLESVVLNTEALTAYNCPLLELFLEHTVVCREPNAAHEFEYRSPVGARALHQLRKNSKPTTLTAVPGRGRPPKSKLQGDPSKSHWARPLFWSSSGEERLCTSDTAVSYSRVLTESTTVEVNLGGHPLSADDAKAALAWVHLMQRDEGRVAIKYKALRQDVVYDVEFASECKFNIPLRNRISSEQYSFFRSTLTMSRTSPSSLRHVQIELVQADLQANGSLEPGVVCREVFSLATADRPEFVRYMQELLTPSHEPEKDLHSDLAAYFLAKVQVEGETLRLSDIAPSSTGYMLKFALPERLLHRIQLTYQVELALFQTADRTKFPITISEPTQRWRSEFHYSAASDRTSNLDCFVGSHASSDGDQLQATLIKDHRRCRTERQDDGILLPGEGGVIFWK